MKRISLKKLRAEIGDVEQYEADLDELFKKHGTKGPIEVGFVLPPPDDDGGSYTKEEIMEIWGTEEVPEFRTVSGRYKRKKRLRMPPGDS